MARRLMFVQLKTGYNTDRGPSWVCWCDFNKTWKTARFHGREVRRFNGVDANFYDVDTDEWFSRAMYDARQHTVREIANTFGVSRPTIYRHLDGIATPPPVPHSSARSQ